MIDMNEIDRIVRLMRWNGMTKGTMMIGSTEVEMFEDGYVVKDIE